MNPITCATTTSTQTPGITTDIPTTTRISNNSTTNSINVSRSTTGMPPRISTSTTANVTTTKIDNNATTTVPGINEPHQIFKLKINLFDFIDKIMYITITTYENVSRSSVCIHVSCNWMPK